MRIAGAIVCLIALTSCQREKRDLRPAPVQAALYGDAARESPIQPGGPQLAFTVSNPASGNAYSISEGQRLYEWYNCAGCHSHGGGGIGPPLIKKDWIYGGEPANLFDTIVKGRPNGMPTWGGRVPEYQVWQIIAYVRSMNQLEPLSATSPRADELHAQPTIRDRRHGVTK
jgi:cytochrome c oxidase cbb3-type subunit III